MRLKKVGRRMRTSTVVLISFAIVVGLGLIGTLVWMLVDSSNNYQTSLDSITRTNQQYIHTVYVANMNIEAGDIITEDMVRPEEHIISSTYNLFDVNDIGATALVDITIDSVVSKDVITRVVDEPTEREVEYSCFYIGENIKTGDLVDVRIRFTNGEDFVVLSKKRIGNMSQTKKTCLMMMTELEMQRLASAIIDVAEYNCFLYSVVYTQPTIQEESEVNYPMRGTSAMLAIKDSVDLKNEAILRESLESRLNVEAEVVTDATDISNISDSNYEDISNTNEDGNKVSSDYKEDENGNPIITEE